MKSIGVLLAAVSLAFVRLAAAPEPVTLTVNATRDTRSGNVILKLVNVQSAPQPLKIDIHSLSVIRVKTR